MIQFGNRLSHEGLGFRVQGNFVLSHSTENNLKLLKNVCTKGTYLIYWMSSFSTFCVQVVNGTATISRWCCCYVSDSFANCQPCTFCRGRKLKEMGCQIYRLWLNRWVLHAWFVDSCVFACLWSGVALYSINHGQRRMSCLHAVGGQWTMCYLCIYILVCHNVQWWTLVWSAIPMYDL